MMNTCEKLHFSVIIYTTVMNDSSLKWTVSSKTEKIKTSVRSTHISDLLDVNICVNYSLNNWLYLPSGHICTCYLLNFLCGLKSLIMDYVPIFCNCMDRKAYAIVHT